MLAAHVQPPQAQQQHRLTPSSHVSTSSPSGIGPDGSSRGTVPPTPNHVHPECSGPSDIFHTHQSISHHGFQGYYPNNPALGHRSLSSPASGSSGITTLGHGFLHSALLSPSHPVLIPGLHGFNPPIGSPRSSLYSHYPHRLPLDPNNAPQPPLTFHGQCVNLTTALPPPGSYPLPSILSPALSDSAPPGPALNFTPTSDLLALNLHQNCPLPFFRPHLSSPQLQPLSQPDNPLRLPYSNLRSQSAPSSHSSPPAASLSIAALSLQPDAGSNQMYVNRHESRDSQTSLNSPTRSVLPNLSIQAPRSTSHSGQFPPPSPRPRTGSCHSERCTPNSRYVAHRQSVAGVSLNVPHPISNTFIAPNPTSSLRPRTDSQNSRPSPSSHGFTHGPSSQPVKPPNYANDPHHISRPPPPSSPSPSSTRSSSPAPPPHHSRSSSNSSGRSPTTPSHHHPANPSSTAGAMVRRPSPLAHATRSCSPGSGSQPSSHRLSRASTVTPSGSHPPSNSDVSSSQPHPRPDDKPKNDDDDDDDDDDDHAASSGTASDADHRPTGHRSTPGTSVDSTISHSISSAPKAAVSAKPDSAPPLDKHSKVNLGNKLRRALHRSPFHEDKVCAPIPESDLQTVPEKLKSSSASVAGVRLNSRPIGSGAPAPLSGAPSTSGRRFGFLNPKANSSTDNLSISSTVSSASVMIRKLGNLGKSARRTSVMGLTKMFKDKNSLPGMSGKANDDKTSSLKRSGAQAQKNVPSTSVAQVNAIVDRSLSDYSGMTPAAAFIHQQKQHFAEQERAAAAAAATARVPSSPRLSPPTASGPEVSKPTSATSGSAPSATEARKKLIEREKEKLKSRKGRKWGFSGSSGSPETEALSGVSPPAVDEYQSLSRVPEGEDDDDWDDRTLRGPAIETPALALPGSGREQVEETAGPDNDGSSSEYDSESLFGNADDSIGSQGLPVLKPRPAKEAVPKKGILKNAHNFSQAEFLARPPLPSSKTSSLSSFKGGVSTPGSSSGTESGSQDFGTSSGLVIELGGVPDLRLEKHGSAMVRRATFARNLSVHSTWPPAIYDRRGEPATCNRLTPTLAQRIKEELNAYKMEEMEVHYASRTHTHFFV